MNSMRHVRILVSAFAAFIVLAGSSQAFAEENTRIRDVVYGHKFGMALTLDVVKPANPNGAGVIFIVSGGFVSDLSKVEAGIFGPARYAPLLEHGYTVFLVCHGSEPKFTVSEIVPDIQRSVRFIRAHAKEYGVDPDRLGMTGVSSGGFLALMIATKGDAGNPNAKDAVDRASSRVQAVGCFCPSSDLVNYGKTGRSFLEFEPVKFAWHIFGLEGKSRDEQIQALRDLSPLDFITKQTPPTLIIHGDADPLVPIEQSERFDAKLATLGVPHRLVTRKNAGHVWLDIAKDFAIVADWFDKHLLGTENRK
jgi:dipeptidyl aminopeptidase/acylaminoacyl peptidase